ncbi:MAG TPA: hypothetical protein VER37_04735, partial [Thermomicrobiales bacterium]|nr:hypothetical protein [Thermomicrobiales bacterium]
MAAQSDIVLGRSSVVAPAAPVLLPRRVPLWRRLLAWLFLLLFCLAAPLALLAGWGRWAVSDADRYAATVRTAAADP